MVFENVEIWRAVVLSKKEAINFIKDHDGIIEDDEEDIYLICDALDVIFTSSDLKVSRLGPCCSLNNNLIIGRMVKKYPRAKFSWKNVPVENIERMKKIQQYKFFQSAGCGNFIEDIEEEESEESDSDSDPKISDYCGYFYVCNHCLGMTTNGYYDIENIYNQTIEAVDYCSTCNISRCNLIKRDEETFSSLLSTFGNLTTNKIIDYKYQLENNYHLQGDDDTLTVNQLVDEEIKQYIDDMTIKNYYRVDDCLSCS